MANEIALGAVQRLAGALRRAQSVGPERGRLLAPNSVSEHAPLTVLELSGEDIAILSATAATLGHPLLDPDMADLVQTYAQQLSGQYRQVDRTELISLIARLAGLLEPDLIAVEARRHEDAARAAVVSPLPLPAAARPAGPCTCRPCAPRPPGSPRPPPGNG